MYKSRLGISFELLCRRPIRPESLKRQAMAAGAMAFLVEASGSFALAIYPLDARTGRAAALHLWVLRQATRHFEELGQGRGAALELTDSIAFTDLRPPADVTLELGSAWCPAPARWPAVAELVAAAERLQAWWRAAA